MGKSKKRYLVRRILAMMLAAAMTVTMVPTTALAAPAGDDAEEGIVNVAAEESGDVTAPEDEGEPKDTGDVVLDGAMADENGETQESETDVLGVQDNKEDESTAPQADEAQPQADTELKEYSFEADEKLMMYSKKVYSGRNLTYDSNVWADYAYYIMVYTNGNNAETLAYCGLDYQAKWQVKKDDKFEDMPDDNGPVNAGEYRLHIVIPAVEGVSKESSYDIPVEITKAEAVLTVSLESVAPGSLVKDIKIASAYAYSEDSGAEFYYNATAASSDLGITLKVKDPYTNAELAGETKLLTTVDYIVAAEAVFTDRVTDKDNYVLEPVTFPLRMQGLIESAVSVTLADKWKEDNKIVYTYNGSAIAAPAAGTDYTMEVVQRGVTGQDGNPVKIEAAADKIAYAWYDDSYEEMDSAPTDAGRYYYKISYQGETGLYDESSAYITVEVQPMTLILVPKWKDNKAPVLYPGMSEANVLSAVDYDIKNAEGKVLTATDGIDRDHMWGTTYSNTSATMPYEPVFKLQIEKSENDVTDYENNNGSIIKAQRKYRVIFSGNKAAYYADGRVYSSNPINTKNENNNYKVDVANDVLAQNVLEITAEAGSAAEIDITAILKDGAGETLENPIKSVYQAKQIYEKRSEYKKAKVTADGKTLVQDADKSLTYMWSKQEGTYSGGMPRWQAYKYTNSPSNAGTYKLEISYKDPTNEYHAASKSVYYVIEKQKVKIVPTSAPKALTETKVHGYIWNSEFGYEIQTADGQKLSWNEDDYSIDWMVTKESGTEYVNASYDMFAKDVKYRLEVSELELYSSNLYNNYVDYEETVTGTGESADTKKTYLHGKLPIELEVMGETEILIKIDPTRLSKKTKVYDGESVSLAADLKNGLVSVVKKSDGTAVTDVTPEYRWHDDVEDWDVSVPVNGGSYTLYARFDGNTTYHKADEVEVASITITPKELTVEAVAQEPVVAGTQCNNAYDSSKYKFTGVVPKDANAFTYQYYYDEYEDDYYYGFPAFDYLYTAVKDAKGSELYSGAKLRGNAVYTLMPNMGLNDFYSRNYEAVGKEVSFTTVRGNSRVSAASNNGIQYTAVADTIDGMTHTIKPTAGIKYSDSIYDCGDKEEGNLIALRIDVPAEYEDSYTAIRNASYKNSIEGEKAKGYVLSDNYGYIVAAFDASAKDKKEFDIRWEEGYIEHYVVDFTGAVLMEDLRNAVEPKSIAFNAPDKKMVVGGTQQLDVKLTKKQQSDIIRLMYKTSTEAEKEYLNVNPNTGYVTALKAGKANVIAYPVRREGGQYVKIPGAREAKVTITITEVTAPKIQKVQPWGSYAGVTYGQVNDGYRREIYVLKGKNIKADEFEKKIASMRNEQWRGIFEIAPVYRSNEWTIKKNAYRELSTLDAETDYTVYVRNVSGIRTLSDGSRVVASASGSVKSFKTTKPQVNDLEEYFGETQPVTPIYEYEGSEDVVRYEVELLKGSVQISARGEFALSAQKELAADTRDYAWYPLPLSANLKKVYVAPKLVYQIAEMSNSYSDKAYDYDSGYYYVPTSRAKINGAGKIQLKEAGYVYIRVLDSISGEASEWVPIRITVDPKRMVGKKAQLQVGQSVSLYELVDYKNEKNKVIKGSFTRAVELTEEARKKIEEDEHFVVNGSGTNAYITAVKPNGNLEGLKLTDKNVGGEATVSVKSTTLAPVTGLKATGITDKYADMWFQYAGYGNLFRIDVIDGRGRTIESTLQNASSLRQYDAKSRKYYYAYRVEGLTQQSNYTVKITAIYRTTDGTVTVEAPKVASAAIKSTKMPASYKGLTTGQTGGIDIYVTSLIAGSRITNTSFSSGNTYTLIAAGEQTRLNEGAKVAVTDTLTWTSSNSKVATVKANAGTYTASLKAVRTGSTVIEVKSKITKQVIARYGVYVYAVEDAYSYYGENEPLQAISVGTSTPVVGEVFTQDVTADSGNVNYPFTAPTTGTYYFWSTGNSDTYGALYDGNGNQLTSNDDDRSGGLNIGTIGNNFSFSYYLTAGQTVYISVRDYYEGSFACTLHVNRQNPAN